MKPHLTTMEKRGARRQTGGQRPVRRRGEGGEALILALIFLVLFSLVMAALLSGIGTNLSMTSVTKDQAQLRYAADGGLEWAASLQRQQGSFCGSSGSGGLNGSMAGFTWVGNRTGGTDGSLQSGSSNVTSASLFSSGTDYTGWAVTDSKGKIAKGTTITSQSVGSAVMSQNATGAATGDSISVLPTASGTAPLTVPNGTSSANVKVQCQPISGLGSNSFGGYAVITGINYPGNPSYPSHSGSSSGSQEFAGNTSKCQSISADPIGAGSPTYGKSVTGTSTSPPQCIYYPAGTAPPSWLDAGFSPTDTAVGNPDGTTSNTHNTVTSASLFTGAANYVGWAITDSDGAIPAGTLVNNENNGAHQATLSQNATGTISGTDIFTLTASLTGYSPLQSVYSVDNKNIWAVGNSLSGPGQDKNGEGIFWFDGEDDWEYVGGSTGSVSQIGLSGVWGMDTTDVWAVGAKGTILYCGSNCTNDTAVWTPQAASSVTGSADGKLTNGQAKATSSSLFSGTASYVGWTIADSMNKIPANTTITAQTNPDATMNHNASGTVTGDIFTVTPPVNDLLAVTGNPAGDVWAVGKAGTILTCTASCTTGSARWVRQSVQDGFASDLQSVFSDGSGGVWAAGGTGIVSCVALCDQGNAVWTTTDLSSLVGPATLTAISGTDSTHIWAVGTSGTILACTTAPCTTAANWVKQAAPTVTGTTVHNIQGVVAADATDVWVVGDTSAGGNPGFIGYCSAGCSSTTPGWITQTSDQPESTLYSVTATPPNLRTDPSSWSGGVWAVGVDPTAANQTGWVTYSPSTTTTAVLAKIKGGSLLNGQGIGGGSNTFATPFELANGFFDQYSTGACPSTPTNLTIDPPYSYRCVSSVPSAVQAIDEVLPNQSVAPYSCVKAGSCADMGASTVGGQANPKPVTVGGTCGTYYEYAPGYYKTAPKFTAGKTYYFESGVYYFNTGGWGAMDTTTKKGNTDGVVTAGSITVTSSLFSTTTYVGYAIGDMAGALDADTTITAVNTATHTATLSKPAITTTTGDAFTVANPYYIVGGHASPGDTPTVVSNSPCYGAIAGATDNYTPTGSWFIGGGSGLSPNGTGVEWIAGGGTWYDVHTIDLELFTREAPPANVANEGAQGISLREIPPTCPAGAPAAGNDGAVHPGPWCVTTASKWAPSAGGGLNQTLQIDANNHDPYVYIHGAVYMPDTNMVLFTNQPQRDVWTGPIDVNSLEMTYDSANSPPLQIIAGAPTLVQFELIATATDAAGNTTLSEEAVATVDYTQTPTKLTIQSWRVCNGTSTATSCQS